MQLDDLLDGDESLISTWLCEKNLIHQCDCGYTVYSPDAVDFAVQEKWGDERSEEINNWANGLADQFGWMYIESSAPKHDIYHCQYCAESELSLLTDLMRIAEEGEDGKYVGEGEAEDTSAALPIEQYRVFVDESYTSEFPRKDGGALTLAAFIVSEADSVQLKAGLEEIMREVYGKSPPTEFKYSGLAQSGGLRARARKAVTDLIKRLPSCAIIAVHVTSEGLMGEKIRSLKASQHYDGIVPSEEELAKAASQEVVEAAVRQAVTQIATTVAMCVGNFIGSLNARATLIFDPRKEPLNEALREQLEVLLPNLPVHVPLIPHQGSVVMPMPSSGMTRLGDAITIDISTPSIEVPGLQLADYFAGDIRTFFREVPEPLEEIAYPEPLVNKKVLFPEVFRMGELSAATKAKIKGYQGESALLGYMDRLPNGNIACYAKNGQMRNVNLSDGIVFDLMD